MIAEDSAGAGWKTLVEILLAVLGGVCSLLLGMILARVNEIRAAGVKTHAKANETQGMIGKFELTQVTHGERIDSLEEFRADAEDRIRRLEGRL